MISIISQGKRRVEVPQKEGVQVLVIIFGMITVSTFIHYFGTFVFDISMDDYPIGQKLINNLYL